MTAREQPARGEATDDRSGIGLLRFLTCGSVDDGKSTLIGRLLYDSGRLMDDQLASLERDSARRRDGGEGIDFSLLLDGLAAEREQGITIDVAWRFFATARRRFIVADTPGHEQYTRNMATGAAQCDLAIVLIDARHGVVAQTLRHALIASLMGIAHVVAAVNKIDLVGFSEQRFAGIESGFRAATARHGFFGVTAIPLSARHGDNVATASAHTPWYRGPTLLEHLETVEVDSPAAPGEFRMQVQRVDRIDGTRVYQGTVASGEVRPGEAVLVAGTAAAGTVARILTMDGDLPGARAGDAIALTLSKQLDISRGDVLAAPRAAVTVTDQLAAHLVWLGDAPLLAGRSYLFKFGARTVAGSVTRLRFRLDVASGAHLEAESLDGNEIGLVNLSLDAPAAFTPFLDCRALGGFIVIDRLTNATLGVGMVRHALRRATNVQWHEFAVDRAARAALLGQRPAVVWFTGLSGAGKSVIASAAQRELHAMDRATYVLDGDNVRHGLNRDLGFTEPDRVENIRRAAEVAGLMADAGLIVLVSFISPYRADRALARERIEAAGLPFLEVFVDTPVEECRRRDVKGLYARADRGEIANFTGVSAPYEAPEAAELVLSTLSAGAGELASLVVGRLRRLGCLG